MEPLLRSRLQTLARQQDTWPKVPAGALLLLEMMERSPEMKQEMLERLASF